MKTRPANRSSIRLFAVGITAIGLLFVNSFFAPHSARAAVGTNQQLNYQGRLLDSTGAVVPDGLYNFEFKIYQDGDGCVTSGSAPCSGTLKWTESRIQTNRVTVKNGYFAANLGSVTAFGSSVDWNQDTLWLSINIGGTTNTPTPTWDGEMTPFKRLTSTPYALNSAALQGLTASNFVQLAQGVQADSSTANSSIFINKTNASGTPNILQLQKSSSNVFVVGNGGSLAVTPTDNAATISFGTTSQTGTITLGQYNGASTSIINIGNNAGASSTQQVNIATSATGINTLVLGSTSSSSTTTIAGGTGGINITPSGGSNTGVSITPGSNSTAAFKIQSATAADVLLSADTTNNKIIIGNATGTNGNTTQLVVDSATADPSTGTNGAMIYNSTTNKFRCYQNNVWADCISGTANATATFTSGLANVAASSTGVAVENLLFTAAATVSSTVGATGIVAPAGGSFRTCLVKNNAAITAGTLSLRWRVNGVSVGAAACNMSTSAPRIATTMLDPGVTTFSQGDTITVAFDTNAGFLPTGSNDFTVYWSVEYNSTSTSPSGATLQSAYDNFGTITTTDTHNLLVNAADTTTDANVLFDLQCVTACGSNGRFAVQNAATDVFTVNPNSGNIVLAPAGAGDSVFTTDGDSNLQVNYTSTTDATINIAQISITDNAGASSGTLYGLSITNNDNGANTGVPDALAYLNNANAAETVTNGLLVEQTGAGTLTNGIEIRRTAGTVTNGLAFTGTFGSVLTVGGTTVINASGQVPTSRLTGNYVANAATSVLTGLTGGSAGSTGASLNLAFDYSQALSGDVGLGANAAVFGQSGLVFEGSAADTSETYIIVANPTADRSFTFPDVASGNICISGIACAATSGTASTFSGNYVASVATTGGLTGGAAGSNAAALSLSIDQTASLTWTGTEAFNGATSFTPSSTNNVTFTGDNDSNVRINNTLTSDVAQNGLAITLTDNAAGVTAAYYGLNITNADNGANAGVPDALAYLNNANAAETVVDGLLVEQTGAGTLTNGLEIRRTAGTVTNGLTFTGTIGSEIKLQNSETISNGANGTIALGADSGAVTLSLSGTAGNISNTAGALGITAAAGLTLASSANGNIALNPNGTGDVVITQAAGSGLQITASAAPTVDMATISNTGFGTTAAGVNGLQITYVGGAAAVEAGGQRIDLTGGTTAGGTWNGLRVVQGTVTAGTTVQDIKLETAALTTTSGASVINGLNVATSGAINSSTAGSIAWRGLSVTNANVTQGAGGTASATGLGITLGSLTTGGTQYGLNITGSSSNAAGTETAINIGGITPGAAAETGLAIGAGYDTGISILTAAAETGINVSASAAPTVDMVSISNTGQGVATAGVSGLQITYVGGAAAVEASGQRVDLTGGTTAGGTWNGLRVVQGTITTGTTVQDIKLETAALTTTSGATVINGLNVATSGAINNSTAGSIAWRGLSVTNANVTQGAGGTASATGLGITLGSLTTGGTQYGLNITGSSSNAAGTETAINIGGITPGAAAETGLAIGAGYDTGISVLTAAAETGINIAASAAPTVDMVNITNTGQGVTTAGVSGLQITYVGGGAAVEASAQRIDLTGGTTAGGTWNGLRVVQGTVTAGTTVQDIKLETAALTTTSGTSVINGLSLNTAGAINNATTGSITWNALNVSTPNVTQGAGGSASANALRISMGTLTTGGSRNGLVFNNITAATVGQTRGLYFGSANSTTWSDLHSSTIANNNTANIVITKSAVGASANNFTIKNDATNMVNLFELRDLTSNTNQFGGLALSDAFVSRQSYFGEEFTSIRTNCDNATFATATNNLSRGSQAAGGVVSTTACTTTGTDIGNGEISTSSVSGTSAAANVCNYRSGANIPGTNTNGFESIIATSGASTVNIQCLEYIGTATDNTGNMIFNSGNLPQVQVKFRPVQLAQAQRYYLGIGNKVTATNALAAADRGVYFTNCTVPNTPTCGTGMNVVLEDGTAAPTTVVPTNALACPANDQDGNASTANVFAYGRLEFRKATSTTSVEIQAFVDYNVTNGIHETSCGTLLTTANAMGNTAMTMVAMTAVTATGAAITSQLDLDYFRVWQDDAPAFGGQEITPAPTPGSTLSATDLSAPAPLAVDAAAGPDPLGDTIIDFMAATDQDAVFYNDVYIHGTLYADKIKANQIEGIEVLTDKINSLQSQVAKAKTPAAGSAPPSKSNSLNVNNLSAVNLSVLADIEAKGGLIVDKDARFNGKTIFALLSEFNGPVRFNGQVSFSSDTGGTAVIKKDSKKVIVKFSKEYATTPIITANYLFKGSDAEADEASLQHLLDGGYSFTVSQTTTKGFIIILNKPAEDDINFTWIATQINNPQISQNQDAPTSGQ